MTPSQRAFLEDEFFQLTLGAAMRRGGVYGPKLTERERRPVHTTLREVLESLLPQYEGGGVDDDVHLANIDRLAQTVTTRHAGVLEGGRFRIGNAQKALNLHLKYRWCVSGIEQPPHCPFDYYVLREIPAWRNRAWTAIDSTEQYRDLVAAARAVAGGVPLAEWELGVYNAAMGGLARRPAVRIGDAGVARS
ncbi:MAG: hypothetical protein ACRETJ_01730 [Steroidobacteraceae bacterium]